MALSAMSAACVGTPKLGQYSAKETYQDPEVVELVEAAWRGDADKITHLAGAGADVNSIGRSGATPLMWALNNKSYASVEAILLAGADPNLYVPDFGFAAINLIAGGDDPKMLALLLGHGGNPNNPGNGSMRDRPLSVAANQGRLENVKLLLQAGADINAHDEYRQSAATATFGPANFEVLAYLLEQGYKHDLEKTARGVVGRVVPGGSDAERWKLHVIAMLKARGVIIPE